MAETVAQWPARIEAIAARQRAAPGRLQEWRAEHKTSSAPVSREARQQPLRERVAAARIVAPEDGEVITVLARMGGVAAGVPFVVWHGTRPRMLVAYVNERAQLTAGAQELARRRTPGREELPTTVRRVADAVVQIPPRFWLMPTLPQWGREVYLELPAGALDAGEAVDVRLPTGGAR